MATLKDHQRAMVDLLASGSGIPASASRLAHAMHDVVDVLIAAFPNVPLSPDVPQGPKRIDATTPGLNDKALAADVEACQIKLTGAGGRPKADLFERARAAERRVKELENTVNQLRASNAKLRQEKAMLELTQLSEDMGLYDIPEQAGVRKDDTQESGLSATKGFLVPPGARFVCAQGKTCMNCGAVTTRNVSTCDDCGETL